MQVFKEITEYGSNINIEFNKNISLKLVYGREGEIYWIFDNKEKSYSNNVVTNDKIIVTKENIELYKIISELYEDIINCNIYLTTFYDFFGIKDKSICDITNKKIKNSNIYKRLIHNDKIILLSDDKNIDKADILMIEKNSNSFIISFIKQDINEKTSGHYNVSIKAIGGKYSPFDIVFYRMIENANYYLKEGKEYSRVLNK